MPQQTKFNISEAARVTGKGRSTIQRYIKSGKLSSEPSGDGGKVIEATELIRVFGELRIPDAADGAGQKGPMEQRDTSERVSLLQQQVKYLERENEELHTDKEDLKREKDKLVGIIERQTLLLPAPEEGKEYIPTKASQDEEKPKQPKGKAKPASKKKGLFRRMFGGGKK